MERFYGNERPRSSLSGATPAEIYAACQPVDMMDKTGALPISPQVQQQKTFGRERIWQHGQQLEYTFTALPDCPTKRGQLRGVLQTGALLCD